MMKKLLFWVVGVMCVTCAWADAELTLADVQRGPHTYKIDRRKYVSASQKLQVPFRHTLRIAMGKNVCSATMAGGDIVTAQHCVVNNRRGFEFETTDGSRFSLQNVDILMSDKSYDKVKGADWAVFRVATDDGQRKYIENNSVDYANVFDYMGADLYSIGYGGMKILSDQEIAYYRQQYVKFLKEYRTADGGQMKPGILKRELGRVEKDDGIDMAELYGWFFGLRTGNGESGVPQEWFQDADKLKYSMCKNTARRAERDAFVGLDCQGWGGNSGGGLFVIDKAGRAKIVGVASTAYSVVGGYDHGKMYRFINASEIEKEINK